MNRPAMEPALSSLFSASSLFPQLTALPLVPRIVRPESQRPFLLNGMEQLFSQPLTLTPFASARPCSARCVFCSETLVPIHAKGLSAALRPSSEYFEGLNRALGHLSGLPLGLSLSGLEATDDAAWFLCLLDELEHFCASGGDVLEKVLYSNGAGLCRETTGALLLPRLAQFGLDRVELSRHHFTEVGNDKIMRFRSGQAIADQAIFESAVIDCLDAVPVRLVCLIQRRGVDSVAQVEAYLTWAERLGVTDVVFREYSRLGGLYEPNRTNRHIEAHRVKLDDLLSPLLAFEKDFEPLSLVSGYYYWHLRMRWKKRIAVTFETSDYGVMKARHESSVIHKLVYHANGNLCADWDPNRRVLLSPLN